MKKNYSEKFLKPPTIIISNPKNQSIQKRSPNDQPTKKPFQRKPAGGALLLSRKKGQDQPKQVDSTMQQTNFSTMLQKSKDLKFISCRSQSSLNCSIISKSNSAFSIANSRNEQFNQSQQSSKFLPEESMLIERPNQQPYSRQLFRRKTTCNLKTPVTNKSRVDVDSVNTSVNTSIVRSRFGRKMDNAEQQTKLQSSQISDFSKTFCTPISLAFNKNLVNGSKNSSKDSMRKSNSSGSLRKNQPTKQDCSSCEYHQRELKEAIQKNQRLQRILQHKEQEISVLNKKLQQNQKRNRELDRKLKEFQNSDFKNKVKALQQQLLDSQEECQMLKDAYTKTLQEVKYKNVQNTTLKKYQTQCQSLERKLQMLVSERNELRQRLSNVNVSAKSSYTNYPSSLSRQSKSGSQSRSNLAVNNNQFKTFQKGNMRQSFTSRNEQNDWDGFEEEGDKSFRTMNSAFRKKSTYDKCYEDGSQSQLISLSELSEQSYL